MDRIWTLPNAVSVVRLACVPWFAYLVYGTENLHAAAWLLAILGSTDWIDGQLARRLNQVSTFGKVFDPSVDRIMLLVALFVCLETSAMPLWFGLAALGREALVVLGGVLLALLGAARIDVHMVGKAGAFGLMVCLPLFLVSIAGVNWSDEARWAAWLVGVPALALAWLSLIEYAVRAKRALAAGRRHRVATKVDEGVTK